MSNHTGFTQMVNIITTDRNQSTTKSGTRTDGTLRKKEEALDDENTYVHRQTAPLPEKSILNEYWADENYTNDGCNFGGRVVRVAVAPQPPFVDCQQDNVGDWTCSGSNIEVISLLEQRLNFRAEWLVLTKTQRSSKSLPDTNYTGVIGIVASGKALLSANGLLKTADREANLILSEPFDFFRFHFLLSKSVRDHDHLFLKPFSGEIWLALITSALAIFPLMYLINTTSSHYAMRDDPLLRQVSTWGCIRYVLFLIASAPYRLLVTILSFLCCCWCCSTRKTSSARLSNGGPKRDSLDKQVNSILSTPNSRLALDLATATKPAKLKREERKIRRQLLERQWALERRRARRSSKRKRKSGFSKWPYTLWYVMGSLANQGGEEEDLPTATSTRILIMFWWFYIIVVTGYHSGILTAILSFPRQPDFIQTLEDFMTLEAAEKGAMKLWMDQNGELAELLSSTDNLHKSALLELAEESGDGRYPIHKINFRSQRQHLLYEVSTGRGAYMEDKSTINLIITHEYLDQRKCLYKPSRFPIDVQPMSLVLSRKLSLPCIRLINRLMVRILRTGLSQKWRRQYEPQGNECLHTVVMNAGNVAKIELRHLIFAFWLLAGGLVLGAVLLLLELVWLFTAELDSDSSDSSSDETSSANSTRPDEQVDKKKSKSAQIESKQAAKKAASEAKRKKRFRRALGIFSTLLEGRVYAGFLSKLSDNVQSQARRASQALFHIPRSLVAANEGAPEAAAYDSYPQQPDEPIRRRQMQRLNRNKVDPL